MLFGRVQSSEGISRFFPRRSRHLGHRHASVTSDEVKCTRYVVCTYHIDEHVRTTQSAQRASNSLNVLDYELRRKYVHSYVSNCCSVLVFGVRNNREWWEGGVTKTYCCAQQHLCASY